MLPEVISKLHVDSFNKNTFFRENLKMLFENSHGKSNTVKLFSLYDPSFLDALQLFSVLAKYVN